MRSPAREINRFVFEVIIISLLLSSGLALAVLQWSDLSDLVKVVLLVGLPMGVVHLANVISVPCVESGVLHIKYGPYVRKVAPARVKVVRRNSMTGRYRIVERSRFMGYEFTPKSFVEGDGVESELKRWADLRDIPLE